MALVDAAEFVGCGRVPTRKSPVAHSAQFGRREQLQLPHEVYYHAQDWQFQSRSSR
jgi:hypothetical protein